MENANETKNKPVAEVRRGYITAAIWRRVNKDGVTLYSVSLTRSYKDDAGKWATSNSFSGDELLVVAEVAKIAWNQVHRLRQQDYEARRAAQTSQGTAAGAEEVPF